MYLLHDQMLYNPLSNIVKLKDNIIEIQIFSKEYKKFINNNDNFKYYINDYTLNKFKEIKNLLFVKRTNRFFINITYITYRSEFH